MNADGFLTFTALSVIVESTRTFRPTTAPAGPQKVYDRQLLQFHDAYDPPFIVDTTGKVWKIVDAEHRGGSAKKLYVAVLGRMCTWSATRFFDPEMLVQAILLEEYEEGRFRRSETSWFMFNRVTCKFEGWTNRQFAL